MSIPQPVIAFLNENARSNGSPQPTANDDLFKLGALDSFALIDFVTVLEEHCDIKIPDADVVTENFQTIAKVERYLESRRLSGNAAARS